MGTGGFCSGGKTPEREADHSLISSAEVKNNGAIPPFPAFMAWCLLVKYRENFAFLPSSSGVTFL
jgi:hypothetical protein